MKKPFTRRRLFIDRPIQLALMVRALSYWTICLTMQIMAMTVFPVLFSTPDNPFVVGEQFWWTLGFGVLGSIFALPLILMDVLRLSHRWVGPMLRLRSLLRSVREGHSVGEVRFRDGDFWPDLAADFNGIVAELSHARAAQQTSASAETLVLAGAAEESL